MKNALTLIAIAFISAFIAAPVKADDAWTGIDGAGVMIMPQALAQYCGISQDDVAYVADNIECLNEILLLKNDPSGNIRIEAKKVTEQILKQSVAINISEGMGQKIYSFKYPTDNLEGLADALSYSSSNKELLSAIMLLEKEDAYLQNKILMIKASELQFNSLYKIDAYREKFE